MRFSNIFVLVVGVIAVNIANAAPDQKVEATRTVGFARARATGGVNHSIGSNIVRDFKGADNVNRRENENTGKDKVERRVN